MRYLLIIVAGIIVLAVPTITHRYARRRVNDAIGNISVWERLPDHEARDQCIFDWMRGQARSEAMRWQLTAALMLGVLGFAGVSFWVIYDVANESHQTADAVAVQTDRVEELVGENCRLSREFLADEAFDSVNDIRRLQAQRDALAMDIVDTPGDVTAIPGYFDAPFWFRDFLTDLLDQQVAEANQSLGTMDAELAELRARRDELQALLDGQHCPPQ